MKVVIVGGVAGGASTAARLRRNDENAEIIIIERTGFISYANCGLPYYIGKVITDPAKLTVQTPEIFRDRFAIDVRVKQEVTSIDRENKSVTVRNLVTGEEYTETYDKLVLAPGAKALMPNVPGTDDKRIFTLRTVEDTFTIFEYLENHDVQNAVVVGGGFIGLECAENLFDRGIKVDVVQRTNHVMPQLDEEIASVLQNRMRYQGIKLHLGSDVIGFEDAGEKISVLRRDQKSIEADIVIMAIGVRAESGLAKDAGLELGLKDTIVVDDHLRTSDPDIYAVGDAIQVTNIVTGKPAVISLAGPANKQGRICADNICGIDRTFKGSLGTFVMKMTDLTVAGTGLTYEMAIREGYDADYILLGPPTHASYYPGATELNFMVVFDKSNGRILGAECAGFEGVDKRIDVMAMAVTAKMDAYDLTELDLSYAPPYSAAKDPANFAGYIIQDILEGRVKQVHWDDVEARDADDVVLDVRPQRNFNQDHIDGAIHIELDDLRQHLDELPKDKKIFVHCVTGLRSYIANRMLLQHGFDSYNVAGGFNFYDAVMMDRDISAEDMGPCGLPISQVNDR